MPTNTPRLALPRPIPDDTVDVPRDFTALTDKLDPVTAIFALGLANARPAAGTAGRFYFATDTGVLSFDTGAAWVDFQGNDPIPVGTVSAFTGTVAPAKWLLCDGSTVLRATYPALYALCGASFATGGEAADSFRLPDLRGRSVIGNGQGTGLTNRALGAKGGEESHVLSATESGTNPNASTGSENTDHVHTIGQVVLSDRAPGTAWANATGAAGPTIYLTQPATGGRSTAHQHALSSRAADVAHNTMHPYLALGAIVKAL